MIKTIEKCWGNFYKDLSYEESLFRDPEQVSVWQKVGYHLPSTTILINQTFSIHDYPQIEKNFSELVNVGICFHKLVPGHYLPTHVDKYGFYKSKNKITDSNQVHRYVVFLEDWKDGHILTVNDTVYTGWKAGDCVGWAGETPHSAINLGIEDRYTLQITGTYEG